MQQGKLISNPLPLPVYPSAARAAGVSGEVVMDVTIARDGSVASVVVLSGDAMLAPAAAEAVRQWKYQPTLLNEQPIEVITDVSVNFTLGQ